MLIVLFLLIIVGVILLATFLKEPEHRKRTGNFHRKNYTNIPERPSNGPPPPSIKK